jgi:hypothetical protein
MFASTIVRVNERLASAAMAVVEVEAKVKKGKGASQAKGGLACKSTWRNREAGTGHAERENRGINITSLHTLVGASSVTLRRGG